MTENGQWQPPVSGEPVPAPTPSSYGQNAGWTPPPKPGLIPLRPLDFGTILAAPYQALRRNPRPTFGVSLLIQGAILFLSLLVTGVVAYATLGRVDFAADSADSEALIAGAVGSIALSALIPAALSLPATAIMQGIVVLEVSRQSLGERLRFPRLWSMARGRIGALVGYSLLVAAAWLVVVGVFVAIAIALSLLGTGGIVAAVLLGILAALGITVTAAWLTAKLAFVPSIIMLERRSIRSALSRSWILTRAAFWKVFGTILLVAVILSTATSLVTTPLQLLSSIGAVVLAPTGDETMITVVSIVGYVLLLVAILIVSAISLVVQSATTSLLYIDQRVRKEGLDLELARYVESRHEGRVDAADPYATAAPAVPAAPAAPAGAAPGASPWA